MEQLQTPLLVGGETALLLLHSGQFDRSLRVAGPCLPARTPPLGDQFRRLVVASAGEPLEPLRQRLLDPRPMLVHEARERSLDEPFASPVGQASRYPRERHAAGGDAACAPQQQQVLQRARFDAAVAVLAESDKPALDNLRVGVLVPASSSSDVRRASRSQQGPLSDRARVG